MKEALEQVGDFIALEVLNVMRASVVTLKADHFFRSDKTRFAQNPGNTLPYVALKALEDRSIVTLHEVLRATMPEDTVVRRSADLFFHRLSLSHPMTVKWREPGMQEFFDERSQWRDLRPALVWDLQQALNEELRNVGGRRWNETFEVGEPMAATLELILKLSVADVRSVPPIPDLLADLRAFKDGYVAYLVEHPDGKTTEPGS